MDNTHLFSTRGSSYELARPGYPGALINYLYGELHFAQAGAIADIGSGTGKFSRQLLVRGSRVYCVEPNDEMRRIAEQKLQGYAGFISLNGTASDTGIMEPVDAVTAAQAFHWFDRDEFRDECRRILKPGGRVCLIWNLRVPDSPITEECRSVFRQYCPRFKDFNIGMREDSPEIYEFFGGREHCDKAVFESNEHLYNMNYLCFNKPCSWTDVVRHIEKKARNGSSFYVFRDKIFGPNDTIEKALVKMDLENAV